VEEDENEDEPEDDVQEDALAQVGSRRGRAVLRWEHAGLSAWWIPALRTPPFCPHRPDPQPTLNLPLPAML